MAVTAQDLLNLVHAGPADQALADRCVALAPMYVTQYRTQQAPDPENLPVVPPEVIDQAVLSCAEDIFTRSKSQNGVILTNYQPGEDGSGVTIRIGRDPLAPVRPLLRPWVPEVFAL